MKRVKVHADGRFSVMGTQPFAPSQLDQWIRFYDHMATTYGDKTNTYAETLKELKALKHDQ